MSKLKELEKRLREEPDNLGLRVAFAGALREAKRHDEAVELYRSVAIAYRDQGRPQQAVAVCRSILAIAPTDPSTHALMSTLVDQPGRTPPSEEVIDEVETPPPIEQLSRRSAPPAEIPLLLDRRSSATDMDAPARRSSIEETPLPRAVPYHVADPTTAREKKMSTTDLLSEDGEPLSEGAQTRPGSEDGTRPSVVGIANAARRISASLTGPSDRDDYDEVDVSAELDTRQRPKLDTRELAKIAQPPPTVPYQRVDIDDDADTPTPPPLAGDEAERTEPLDLLGPSARRSRAQSRATPVSPFFAPLPSEHRAQVLERFTKHAVATGSVVIRQGETGHPLVLVARGRLDVRAERADGRIVQVGTIAAGEYVGEAALLARAPAGATVLAATDTTLLFLAPRDFYEIAAAFPALWAELKDMAERRTREHEQRMRALK